jgi:hypothetical protein
MSSRSPGFRAASAVAMFSACTAGLAAAQLNPETVSAWTAYVTATENRIARELGSPRGFLALDFGRNAAAERRDVVGGGVIVEKMESVDGEGRKIDVPLALVHHWRGEVLIPNATVAEIVSQLEAGITPRQEDVLQSKVLERGPGRLKVYLKLQRKKFVTVVYNTEHLVSFARHGSTRASSSSTATKIAELANPNTPDERELSMDDDRGFLWRLNAYWRYEEVAGGVIAECESISLSREVPSVVRYLVSPLVESTARESMVRTLRTLRAHFAKAEGPSH